MNKIQETTDKIKKIENIEQHLTLDQKVKRIKKIKMDKI